MLNWNLILDDGDDEEVVECFRIELLSLIQFSFGSSLALNLSYVMSV